MPSRPRVQPVLACARCYSLKKKCDRKLPSCSRCIAGGKECVGINRRSRKEVPRSVLQYLEKRLAEIEQTHTTDQEEAKDLRVSTLPNISNITVPVKAPLIVSGSTYSQALQSIGFPVQNLYTTSCVASHPSLIHESKLLYPTERPPHKVPVHGLYYEHIGKRASHGNEARSSKVDPLQIPFEVARRIFDNYVNTILPRYPCFTSGELWHHFGKVYSKQQQTDDASAPELSRFIVSMVLAVGCLASWRRDFSQVAAMSESLYRDAMRYWGFLRQSNIHSVQGILLLIQLGMLFPYINNVYYLCAEVVRMAIGLGLHQEIEQDHGMTSQQISTRRQVFWMVYFVDRIIAISTGSPPCLSDEHITTRLPGCGEETTGDPDMPTSSTDTRSSMKHFLLQLQLYRLQSEIYEIKFFDRAIPDQFSSYNSWVENMEERIKDTLNISVSSDGVVPQWIVNSAHLSQNLLHRPYPGNEAPSRDSLKTATTSAIHLINGYHKTCQNSRLMRTFAVVDNSFQAAIVLLYICGNYAFVIREESLEDQLIAALDNFMAILEVGTQRWPVIAITTWYIKDLREVVFSSQPGSTGSVNDLKLRKELELLLSQRRIRSIYQANTALQHSFPFIGLSPPDEYYQQQPFSDDMWQDFVETQFDFGDSYSIDMVDSSWFIPEQQPALPTTSAELPNGEVPSELPKDVDDTIASLPSCTFCRDQHIRCDRELPCCRACVRSRRECFHFDPILSQEIPRREIYQLLQRITVATQPALLASKGTSATPHLAKSGLTTEPQKFRGINIFIPTAKTAQLASTEVPEKFKPSARTVDPDYIFFGVTSHLAAVQPVMLPLAKQSPAFYTREPSARPVPGSAIPAVQATRPDNQIASRLFAAFYRSVHVWYPVMDDTSFQDLLSLCLAEPQDAPRSRAHELFYLILAIGSQLTKRAETLVGFTPAAYFAKATSIIDTSCDHPSGSGTLHMMQRSLLISIYLLLSPGEGDIWRNLGFAIRLYFDMSHGRFENLDELDETHFAMLARTLYCIEGKVTIAFGRPTVLITGDRLRDDLTQPIRATAEERLSIRFYQISAIKMQLHSLLLSEASLHRDPRKLKGRLEMLQKDLQQWHQSWTTDFIPTTTASEQHNWAEAIQYLEAWGNLQYNGSILVLSRSSSETAINAFDAAREVVSCCGILARQHQKSFSILYDAGHDMYHHTPVIPVDWTTSHLLFSAAIHLLSPQARDAADRQVWERTVRSCFTTMALLETDPSNLSSGFSEVLERLYSHEEVK